jgi:hypothetical protein
VSARSLLRCSTARATRGCSLAGRSSSRTRVSPGKSSRRPSPPFDATLLRPDRKGEKPRFGKLGAIRQWIESVYNTTKSQLSLEDHGGHIPDGVWARVCQRLLALAAGAWHNWMLWETGQIDAPGRHFTTYDH